MSAEAPWLSAKSIKISVSRENSLSFVKFLLECASAAETRWSERKLESN